MSGETKNPLQQAFRASLLVLGIVVMLNLAIGYLRPIVPWLICSGAIALGIWIVIAVIRWRRSRW
jgi:amino acid transporter